MTTTLPGIDFFKDFPSGTIVASVKCNMQQGRLRGQRSTAGPVLLWPLESPHGYTGTILTLYGILKFYGQHEGISIPMQSFTNGQLRIPITDEQLARIEAHREGGQLAFELWLTGLGTVAGQTAALVSNSQGVHIAVPREEWLRVLGECGHGTRRLIELPPAPQPEKQKWEDAAERLQAASSRLAAGDSGGAMTQVRNAVERIVESVGEVVGRPRAENDRAFKNYSQTVKAKLVEKHEDRTDDPYLVLADSMQLAISATEFTSEPPHNDLDAAERVHAELAIATISAIYSYCARTIREGTTG